MVLSRGAFVKRRSSVGRSIAAPPGPEFAGFKCEWGWVAGGGCVSSAIPVASPIDRFRKVVRVLPESFAVD